MAILPDPKALGHYSTDPGAYSPAHNIPAQNDDTLSNVRRGEQDTETKAPEVEDDIVSSMSGSEEHELGEIASLVGSEEDEETGLTTAEGRKYIRSKRRKNRLDTRIAGGHESLTKEAARLADKHVVGKLLINALLIASWYAFSLSISIYNKWMFSKDHMDFHYPLFTTSLHMVVQFALSALTLLAFPSLRPRPQQPLDHDEPVKPLITPHFYLTRLTVCGTTTSLDIGLGNTSLRFITLTFYTMCKSSVLIWVLLFAFLFRLESPSWKLILIIVTMTLGVLMMVFGETAFHAIGFALAMSSSCFSGFRWALTQILLLRHPATSNPFSTIFLLSPIMFVTLFVLAIFSEGFSSVVASLSVLSNQHGLAYVILLLVFPGCLAFCMIASEFTLLQRTNVVTLSICGIFKEVVTIAAAEIVFHDYMTLVNFAGLVVTIASIASYNYLKITRMREEARQRLAGAKPDGVGNGQPQYYRQPNGTPSVGASSGPGREVKPRKRAKLEDDEDATAESSPASNVSESSSLIAVEGQGRNRRITSGAIVGGYHRSGSSSPQPIR